MGTVPTPLDPGAGTVLTSTQTNSWYRTQQLLLRPPSCRVHLTANTSFASGTNPIVWTVEDWDIYMTGDTEQHSTSTSPERITIRTAGRYRVQSMVALSAATAIFAVTVSVYKNTTAQVAGWVGVAVNTPYTVTIDDEIQCVAGDYLTVQVNTTAETNIRGDIQCHMVATWVSN